MVVNFNKKDMYSFGTYLLSIERSKRVKREPKHYSPEIAQPLDLSDWATDIGKDVFPTYSHDGKRLNPQIDDNFSLEKNGVSIDVFDTILNLLGRIDTLEEKIVKLKDIQGGLGQTESYGYSEGTKKAIDG